MTLGLKDFWFAPIQRRENAEKIVLGAAKSFSALVSTCIIVGSAFACVQGRSTSPKLLFQIFLLIVLWALCRFLKKGKSIIAAFLLMVFPCGLGLGAGLTFVIMGIKTINDEGAQEAVVMGAIFSLFWLPFTWAMFRAFIATIKLRWVLKDS